MNNAFKNVGTTVTSALHLPSSKDNQHPPATGAEGKKSHRISVDVEESYKVFAQFQVNLKHLATLYKTEHDLMKSLNENGLYTAKCYQKMLSTSPLHGIVSSTMEMEEAAPDTKIQGDSKTTEKARTGEPSVAKEIKSVSDDDDDDVGYVSFPKMEPEEVLEEQEYNFDKQDTRSSFIASSNNLVLEQGAKKMYGQDPPSKDSLLKKDQETVVVEDDSESKTTSAKDVKVAEENVKSEPLSNPPSEADFPVDELPDDEANFNDITIDSEGVNVMVGVIDDDYDSFHDVIDDDDSFAHDTNPNLGETISDSSDKDDKDDKETKKLNQGPIDPDGDIVEPNENDSSDVELNQRDTDNEPELNNSVENVEKVEPSNEKETLTSFDQQREATYFDVHKLIYKENNSYIAKHSKLVQYAEDWEITITKRVQSMYVEYQKLRKGLNHYISKVNTLESEKKRTEERNKDFPPKKIEKLLRNETKLLGTRRSHDIAGIDLIIFIDEVVKRSYKDAYPLLQKSVAFEMDFSSMQAKMYGTLSAAATLLDQVSRKESLSSSHRLLQLKDSSPEEINFHKFKGDWD